MSGHKPFRILHDRLAATAEGRAAAREEQQLLQEVLTISRLREERGVTADQLGDAWELARESGSAAEAGWASHMVALRNHVAALGGHLECNAIFPDQCISLQPSFDVEATNETR